MPSAVDRLLWYLFAGSRGGPTRIRILRALLDRPYNTHQLSKLLRLDYKTVEYNLRVLSKHVVVVADSPGSYGALYHPSKNLLAHTATFDQILAKTPPEKTAIQPAAAPAERREAGETVGET